MLTPSGDNIVGSVVLRETCTNLYNDLSHMYISCATASHGLEAISVLFAFFILYTKSFYLKNFISCSIVLRLLRVLTIIVVDGV